MKYYLIAGEASGDLHSSNLMKELKKLDKNADFRFWGGDLMKKQGGQLVKHYRDLAFMGFVEVLMNIRTISKNFKLCRHDIISYKPDVLILVDYPGFNLRIAKFAKHLDIRVFYYISPQVWAWKQSRVKKIKNTVDKMYVILPFEKGFYKKFNFNVDFVGHPLLDAIQESENTKVDFKEFIAKNTLADKPVIALLPGSRKQEIRVKLPLMMDLEQYYPDHQFIIAGAPSIDEEFYHETTNNKDIKILFEQTYSILQHSHAAMVTSGTATLETALLNVPETVCYRANGNISYFIARKLIKVRFISLVNLIMDKEIVKEIIHFDLNKENLKNELDKLIFDTEYRDKIFRDYRGLKDKLGGLGASKRAAELMYNELINNIA